MKAELPDVPLLSIEHKDWKAKLFDTRQSPLLLGARYVHGGYVAELQKGDRVLTSSVTQEWNPYNGIGLPEVFEHPFAFSSAKEGEPYIRLGVGQNIKDGRHQTAQGEIHKPVEWKIQAHTTNRIVMSCEDSVMQNETTFGYRMIRDIELLDDGLSSKTTLQLSMPWNHLISWFPHPFWMQTAGNATAFKLNNNAAEQNFGKYKDFRSCGQDGLYRLPEKGGLVNLVNLWGSENRSYTYLDKNLGGGMIEMAVDKPLDHVVLYASVRVASIEPQFARLWKNQEEASWTLQYKWINE